VLLPNTLVFKQNVSSEKQEKSHFLRSCYTQYCTKHSTLCWVCLACNWQHWSI